LMFARPITDAPIRQRSAAAGRTTRAGFTLVEVIAASALSVVLLLGVYRAMDQSARQRRAGTDEAQGDQVAMQLLRTIEGEILTARRPQRPLVFDSAWRPHDATEAEGKSQPLPSNVANPTGRREADEVGIVGTRDALVIPLSSIRTMEAGIAMPAVARVFGWRKKSEVELPAVWQQHLARRDFVGDRKATRRQPRGPAYVTFTLHPMEESNASSSPAWLAGAARLLPPEIQSLTFRYFDGSNWYESWDGSSSDLQAIEIALVARAGTIGRRHQLVVPVGIQGEDR
jgi:prepilin-type N-terminal cleavage/methylation domain-containing protein